MLFGLTATLLACSAELDQPDTAAATRAAAALADVERVADQVTEAEFILVQRCMEDVGFGVHPPTPEAIPDKGERATLSPTVAAAQRDGYGLLGRVEEANRQEQGVSRSDGQQSAWDEQGERYHEQYQAALAGDINDRVEYEFDGDNTSIPSGGCLGSIRESLFGDLRQFLRLSWIAQDANRIDEQDIATDSRWRDASNDWASCISIRGVGEFREPADAVQAATENYVNANGSTALLAEAQGREIAIAVADAECAQQSGTNDAYAAVRSELNAEYLADHETDLVGWRDVQTSASERARDLLDS